jgi:hypothetical protein
MMWLASECVASSEASGQWLYGNHPYTLLNNAIELDSFRFDPAAREKYREESLAWLDGAINEIQQLFNPCHKS